MSKISMAIIPWVELLTLLDLDILGGFYCKVENIRVHFYLDFNGC